MKGANVMKLSIVIPVYFNHDNLLPLYNDLREKVLCKLDCDYEILMVDDGSKDKSYDIYPLTDSRVFHQPPTCK